MSAVRVGFIGLGTMGAGMAANLRKAGHDLVVHDMRRAAAEPFLAGGAMWADTPRAVAEQAELVFASLPGPPEMEEVALGEQGLLGAMRRDAAFFDLTTNAPSLVRRVHAAFAERGAHVLDAPVSGGPSGAASGKMAVWVGGEEAVFERHRRVLAAMSDQPHWVGPIGAGSIAKLVHNMFNYIMTTGLAEVFTMGVKAGVEPLAIWEAVRHGVIGRRGAFDGLPDQFFSGKYEPPAFALRLAHKDVSLACALGRETGVPMRLANLVLAEMTEALNRGWGDRDSRSSMLPQAERAGVSVEVDPARLAEAVAGTRR
ncbi:MAG: NAD(P)-dependent oxidoreductase [Acetobacteraceae bacterium]|nr:NAD(P)-dependent oxidoreductase [Acetobacteraceae bacterium]